jgi:hypothetical protein
VTFGELLTIWTIRAAVALYGFAVAAELLAAGRDSWRRGARWFWTVGCVIYVIHVLVAFHYYHHWSHAAVFEHTARRTEEVVGARVGYGVFVSYVFTVLWVVDTLDWWRGGVARYAMRPLWLHALLHGFFAFIIFNGTVIFETGPIRWFGIGLFAVLTLLLALKLLNSPRVRSNAKPPLPSREGAGGG